MLPACSSDQAFFECIAFLREMAGQSSAVSMKVLIWLVVCMLTPLSGLFCVLIGQAG